MRLGLILFQLLSHDTLQVRHIPVPPVPLSLSTPIGYGPPQLNIPTRQGRVAVWLLRSLDTVFVAAEVVDTTRHWADEFVLSIDTRGDGGASPGHDDFQWVFRRLTDSSVIFRGRNGRWEPPKGDPDWRLKRERSGGGWEVSGLDRPTSWALLLRLDPSWFEGADGRLPRLAFRVFDNDPPGWFAWPLPKGIPQAALVERTPDLWTALRSKAD
ncbi:MAG TPA: hypothetical protein VFH26_03545 [Gemmatimonadales bacterium]|nr:hypothetical protein [Gemmatimonadales bacterium]